LCCLLYIIRTPFSALGRHFHTLHTTCISRPRIQLTLWFPILRSATEQYEYSVIGQCTCICCIKRGKNETLCTSSSPTPILPTADVSNRKTETRILLSAIVLLKDSIFFFRWIPPKLHKYRFFYLKQVMVKHCRFQRPRGLKHRPAATRLLRLWVRIPPWAWMSVCCEWCVLSGRDLCEELITCLEKSYRLWCVVVCDLETSRMSRPQPALGRSATKNKW
jgi:hypothetical protein